MRKSLAVLPIAGACAVGLVLSAAPAYAGVTESGAQNCTTNQTGATRAYSTGTTEHYPPGSGYGIYYNGSTWKVTTRSATTARGGFWFVETAGALDAPGTYAYCLNGTP